MKKKRFNLPALEGSSKGHKEVYALLSQMFPNHILAQEYTYYNILSKAYKRSRIDEEVQNNFFLKLGKSLHADIYDLTLDVIYEIQGQQHYEPVMWSKKQTEAQIREQFQNQLVRDSRKRMIANEADVKLIEIPYYDLVELDEDYIWNKLNGKV